jgi:hypothetical protein
MSKKVGKDCKVALGTNTVAERTTWSITGIVTDQYDASAFTDTWKEYMFGLIDGGTIACDGWHDPADVTGQEMIVLANLYNSEVVNLRLYVDNTSYYEPCRTTSYFSPTVTNTAPTKLSHVKITGYNINADIAGINKFSFTAKVSGVMVLI